MKEHGGHRAVHTARQAANDTPSNDLRTDPRDRGIAKRGHSPAAVTLSDAMGKGLQQRGTIGRVNDLGVELHAVKAAALIGNCGKRRPIADAVSYTHLTLPTKA